MIIYESDFSRFLINQKHFKMLLCLTNVSYSRKISNLSKISDTTYSHTVNVINEFERFGLIVTKMNGRSRNCFLTKKGKAILFHLQKIVNLLDKD